MISQASKRPKDDAAEVSKILKKAQGELRNVLIAYGLEVYDENGPIRVFDDMRNPMKLGDPVLESLWSKARKNAAFSDNDLAILWEELVDHKTRLNEFDSIEKVFALFHCQFMMVEDVVISERNFIHS